MFYFLCACTCVAAAEGDIISFNTIFSDSTGKFSFTYPASLPSQTALLELQKNFAKQKFGEIFLDQEPAAALSLYISQKKEIEYLSDEVSFPLPGILQFTNICYANLGGVQGVSGSNAGIYSISNGKKIELSSLFSKGWEKEITKLIVKEFLHSLNLQLLADYGYTQKESDFTPESARLTEGGLEFVFPANKIAPYAAGEQNVFLSWKSLNPYLNKKSIVYPKLRF